MISSEQRDDAVAVDIPNSWWRDHLHVAVWILVAGLLVAFLRFAAEAVVPFVLSGMLFYALDPAVDALQRWRVPRALGAAVMLGLVLAPSRPAWHSGGSGWRTPPCGASLRGFSTPFPTSVRLSCGR